MILSGRPLGQLLVGRSVRLSVIQEIQEKQLIISQQVKFFDCVCVCVTFLYISDKKLENV